MPQTAPKSAFASTNPVSNYGATTPAPISSSSTKATNTTRIEPKVWLANERTWLNWCRTGVLLGTFGIALVNCSPSLGARMMGVLYAAIAVCTISYGWFLYQKRIRLIKERYAGHFDDVVAPLIIAGSLFVAILVNFILRAVDRERHNLSDGVPKVPWVAAPPSHQYRL